MKKLILMTAVVMSVLVAAPVFAFALGGGRCSCDGKSLDYHRDAFWKKLDLTNEQKTKFEAIRTSIEKEVRPIREKMFDKSVELRRLWMQVSPDKDKITAAQKEVRALRDSISDKITAMKLEIRNILTPEQNEKFTRSHWGKGAGYSPRGGNRGPNVFCPGGYY